MNKWNDTKYTPKKTEKNEESTLGNGSVDFLLLGYSAAHPEPKLAGILRDPTELHLRLHPFLRPAVHFFGVFVQLLSESYVGTYNRSFLANEIDRGLRRHTVLGDEICADDCGAPTDTHDTVNLRNGTRVNNR